MNKITNKFSIDINLETKYEENNKCHILNKKKMKGKFKVI